MCALLQGFEPTAEQAPRRLSWRKRLGEEGKFAACKGGQLEQGERVPGRGSDDPFSGRFVERR